MASDNESVDLSRFLDEEVIPVVFERLDTVFPDFNWQRKATGWEATTWPGDFPMPVEHRNPERLVVYKNRPYWIKVHGHTGVRLIDLINGGSKPSGKEWPEAIRKLARAAGVDTAPIDRASPE